MSNKRLRFAPALVTKSLLWFALATALHSQVQPLTVAQAVERSLKTYPSIRISQEDLNAASARIQLARTAYLPRIDALAQFNRATRNNVFGLLLPQPTGVIPSMSGPVIGSNNLGTVWGSAVGALVTWEPFDFGLRDSNVATSRAVQSQSQAAVKRTEFEIAVASVDAYLTLIAAQQTVLAAQAAVTRSETIQRTITAQVKAELRPGADQSRADGELAAARTQLAQAQQAADIARETLSQLTGLDSTQIAIVPAGFNRLPAEHTPDKIDFTGNPTVTEQTAALEVAKSQLQALEKSYFPKFYLQASAYARGTGAETNGQRLGGLNGLGPNVQDYALGFSVAFPIMDWAAIHAQQTEQNARIRSQQAKAQQIAVDLRAQWKRAVAMENGSRQIAANTPLAVSSARAASQQATARYQAGLANIEEVAETERLLTQAEIDDVLARLGVWRSLLGIATAVGDVRPFIAEAMQ